MKRVLCVMVLALVMVLSACGCKHEWKDATCTTPKTCLKCEETSGEALGHIPGNWETKNPDYVNAVQKSYKYCETCDKVLDTSTKSITKMYEGNNFLFTAREFSDRLDDQLDEIGGNTYTTRYAKDAIQDGPMCGILSSSNDVVAAVTFVNNANKDTGVATHDTHDITGLMGYFYDTDKGDAVARTIMAVVLTCDPSLSFDDAKEVGTEILQSAKTGEGYEMNGLEYMYATDGGKALLLVTIKG